MKLAGWVAISSVSTGKLCEPININTRDRVAAAAAACLRYLACVYSMHTEHQTNAPCSSRLDGSQPTKERCYRAKVARPDAAQTLWRTDARNKIPFKYPSSSFHSHPACE